MNIQIRERPRSFTAVVFTPEMVLGSEALPPGVERTRKSEILPEEYPDPKDSTKLLKRSPIDRALSYFYHLVKSDGTRTRLAIGDYILTDEAGRMNVCLKDNFGSAYEVVGGEDAGAEFLRKQKIFKPGVKKAPKTEPDEKVD